MASIHREDLKMAKLLDKLYVKKMQEQIDQLKQTLIQVVDNAEASTTRMNVGKAVTTPAPGLDLHAGDSEPSAPAPAADLSAAPAQTSPSQTYPEDPWHRTQAMALAQSTRIYTYP